MSRLDRHVALVQSKLGLGRFLTALAYTGLGFIGIVWVIVVVGRAFQIYLPREMAFAWAGAGVAVLGAVIWSLFRKPTDVAAAVAIDEVLGLKEKFSTALAYRNSSDPFAIAAVKDAEHAADNVSLHKRFPLPFPTMAYWTIAAAGVLLLTVWMLPNFDLFGKEALRKRRLVEQQKQDDVRHTAERALATVNSYPKTLQNATAVQLAKKDLENLLNQPINDPAQANRTAFKALEQANEAIKEEIKNSDQFARAQSDQKMLRSLNPTPDEQGPVADAQRDISKGDFAKAIENLNAAADKFDKMSDEEKQKTAAQMANMAAQLQQMAQNPAQQKQLQQQLQQMGATPQQAQQLQQAMQQAAQGSPQAQQQLQQMQQQMMQNATPQQQAKMQAMMKQMQAQAQSQATAQQMQQAAQQMAQAMQQAAAGQPGGQQGQQKQGQGQKGGQQGGQMGQAQQQMQQALGQMDAIQKDAQQMAAAADATGAAASDAAGKTGNGDQGQPGGQKGGGGGKGQWQAGAMNNKGGGLGGPGRGGGGGGNADAAPYGIKKEIDPSQNNETGRILASTFVKAGTVKGESKVQLSQAAESAMKDATDEVDEETVSKESQKVVHDYFQTMQNDQQ
jgi:hypothetical protein